MLSPWFALPWGLVTKEPCWLNAVVRFCLPPKILGHGHHQEPCHNQGIWPLQASCDYLELTLCVGVGQNMQSGWLWLTEVINSFCSAHVGSSESSTGSACGFRHCPDILQHSQAAQGLGVLQLHQGQKIFSLSCALDNCYWLVSNTHKPLIFLLP